MRKFKCIIIVSFILGIFFSHTEVKAGAVWLIMGKHKQNLKKGDVLKTKLKFTTWEASMGTYSMTIHYDPEVLRILKVSTSKNSVFYGNLFADEDSFTSGETVVTAFQVEESSEKKNPETFVTIKWKALRNTSSPLPISIKAKTLVDFLWRQVDVLTYGDTTLSPLPTPTPPLLEGLQAYYPFNGNANDESGNGNHGTINGATLTKDRYDNVNSAYSFDGVNDYIQVPDSSTLALTPDFSISLWFMNFSNAQRGRLLTKGPDADRDFHIFWETWTNGICSPDTIMANISSADVVCSDVLSLNTWYHTTFVVRGGKDLSIYVNGVLQSSINTTSVPRNTSNPLLIGAYPGTIQVFSGIIDDVRIYNRALSESEIQELYTEK